MKISRDKVVRNAQIAAMNMPWSGNLYKCPKCQSMREFSMDGTCRKCHSRLRGEELGKFLAERIKRETRQKGNKPIKGLRDTRLTGPIDLFPKDVKHMVKHAGALKQVGMTVGAGSHGKTTVGSLPGRPVSEKRVSFVRGHHVAFTEKGDDGRSRVKTLMASKSVAERERKLHKETRRK